MPLDLLLHVFSYIEDKYSIKYFLKNRLFSSGLCGSKARSKTDKTKTLELVTVLLFENWE